MERIRHIGGVIFLALLLAIMAAGCAGGGPTPWAERAENSVTVEVHNDNWHDARILFDGYGVRAKTCRVPALSRGTCTSTYPLDGVLKLSVYLLASRDEFHDAVLVGPGDRLTLSIQNYLPVSSVLPQSVSMPPTINEEALDVLWTLRGGRWACKGPSCLSERDLWSFSQAVVADAGKYGLDPRLVSGLLLVENPWLDPGAVSHAGAVGLFQVMPTVWDGVYPDCGDLSTVAGNMCYGLRILRYYLDRHNDDFDRALLAYNGCRPHWTSCNWYPSRVQAKGGLAR
jgi:hypothetical protein